MWNPQPYTHDASNLGLGRQGPEMQPLLEWCGPDIYAGALPWSSGAQTEVIASGRKRTVAVSG